MSSDGSGDPEATQHWDYFLLRSFPTLTTTPVAGVSLAAAYLRVQDRNFGPTLPPEPESSFRVSVAIRPMRLKALWADDRWVSHLDHGRYSIGIYDMERRPTVEFIDPFELVQFYVPQRALTHFARESRLSPIEGLRIPEPGTFDPVLAHLACALLPALQGADRASGLFVDHVHLALLAHLLRQYGELKLEREHSRESLAPHLRRRAIEILESRISEDITLAELAGECGLSMAHFARAFKNSVGETPHAWLTKRRIERAKYLLTDTTLKLSDIAWECGFSHRVSLARVFTRVVGVTPSEWRRDTRR
jgi:AraC family transcriptional regulator